MPHPLPLEPHVPAVVLHVELQHRPVRQVLPHVAVTVVHRLHLRNRHHHHAAALDGRLPDPPRHVAVAPFPVELQRVGHRAVRRLECPRQELPVLFRHCYVLFHGCSFFFVKLVGPGESNPSGCLTLSLSNFPAVPPGPPLARLSGPPANRLPVRLASLTLVVLMPRKR